MESPNLMALAASVKSAPTQSPAAAVRGAAALVIEATFLDAAAALTAERGHLTAGEAGRLAAAAAIGALYLTRSASTGTSSETIPTALPSCTTGR